LLDLPAERLRSMVIDESMTLKGVSPQDLVRLVSNG